MKEMDSEELRNLKKDIRQEVRHELQVERMILFSDAVFAIVITLMAIEIHLPETTSHRMNNEEFSEALKHLIPTFIAYVASFIFIGSMWYQHLKLFTQVKKYDKQLVIRNMLLLFFIGLFPFAATAISRVNGELSLIPICLYLLVIITCIGAFALIQHYLLIKHPDYLENEGVPEKEYQNLYEKKVMSIGMIFILIAFLITDHFVETRAAKSITNLWWVALPIIQGLGKRYAKKQVSKLKAEGKLVILPNK